MRHLKISHYISVLFKEGTVWEHKGLLPSSTVSETLIKRYSWQKRVILSIPALMILYFLKSGFSNDFMNYVMTALSIFIGLFTNLIIVLYQRFSTIPKSSAPNQTSHLNVLNNTKIKNFIRQFTFVTGKNLLIATVVIILISIFMLFKSLATVNIFDYSFIHSKAEINLTSVILFLKSTIAITLRFFIIYALIDFAILLLFSLGSLFAFLKGEYRQE